MSWPAVAYGTPRRLPKPHRLDGRVVVLDIAFAADTGGASFEKTTRPFLEGLGERLAMWVDHHDHQRHADYRDDPRFVLTTKAEHGACPELVTPELVERAGRVDTILCHGDFDGLCAAAKWRLRGEEPYEGADDDARAIDTRLGTPSERARTMDWALRARPNDAAVKDLVVDYLSRRAEDEALWAELQAVAAQVRPHMLEAERLAEGYRLEGELAICDARKRRGHYDKTELLLLGQRRAPIAVVHDETTVTVATRFDSGIDLVTLFGLEGGMPTRVSLPAKHLQRVLEALRRRHEGPSQLGDTAAARRRA